MRSTVNSLPSYLPILLPSSKRFAFTLAEVLITLGVIGVVAVLLIPPKIMKLRENSSIKKVTQVYAILQQVDIAMRNENGSYDIWADESSEFFRSEFKKHIDVIDICKGIDKRCSKVRQVFGTNQYIPMYILKNGIIIQVASRQKNNPHSGHYCYGTLSGIRRGKHFIHYSACAYINVAVNAGNSIGIGKDFFQFRFMTDGVQPWGFVDAHSNDGFNTCSSTGGANCTAWVIYNQNMDYLHCRNKISWAGAHSCKEAK